MQTQKFALALIISLLMQGRINSAVPPSLKIHKLNFPLFILPSLLQCVSLIRLTVKGFQPVTLFLFPFLLIALHCSNANFLFNFLFFIYYTLYFTHYSRHCQVFLKKIAHCSAINLKQCVFFNFQTQSHQYNYYK